MIRGKMSYLLVAVMVGLSCAAGFARAEITTFTSEVAFDAAASTSSLNFVGLAPANGYTAYPNPGGLTVGGVNFTSAGNTLQVADPGYSPDYNLGTGRPVLVDNWGGGTGLNVALPAGTTAVGGMWADDYPPTTMTFTFAGGSSVSEPIGVNPVTGSSALSFYGFTSTTPITSFSVQTNDFGSGYGAPMLDTLHVGSANAVPEPASVAMICSLLGACGITIGWRRWRKAA